MSNSKEPIYSSPATTSLIAVAQTALGCGVGLLLAERMEASVRKTVAISLLSVGAASLLAVSAGIVSGLVAGPNSKFGARKRLASIRKDPGFPEDAEIF